MNKSPDQIPPARITQTSAQGPRNAPREDGRDRPLVPGRPLPAEAAQPNAASRESAKTQHVRKLRILVVDDNRDAAESLQMLLQIAGHEALVARDGYEALREGETFAPHVIVLDIGMPGMDGYETCRAIRTQSWGKSITIIALSGWGQDADRESSRAAGFDGHLVKPAGPDDLMQLLTSLAARF